MKLKKIRAKNFLSIGDKGMEIDFTKYGNIISICGENKDRGAGASNASGKSACFEIIIYSLYGQLLKNLGHKEAINIKSKKGLEVEIEFEKDGNTYVILRKRKPEALCLWKNGVEERLGGIPATQAAIDDIIKLSYEAFVNVVYFGQHNTNNFLSCNAANKRAIAENLLSLDKYVKYCDIAKDKKKSIQQDKLKFLYSVHEKAIQDIKNTEIQIESVINQQETWKNNNLNSIERLKTQISNAQSELSKMLQSENAKNYENIKVIEEEIASLIKKHKNLSENLSIANQKMVQVGEDKQQDFLTTKEIAYEIKKNNGDIEQLKKQNQQLLSSQGAKCPVCYGKVNKSNFQQVLDHNEKEILRLQSENGELELSIEKYKKRIEKNDSLLTRLREVYDEAKSKDISITKSIRELEQKKSVYSLAFRESAGSATLILEQKIQNLKEQLEHKENEIDPYDKIIADWYVNLDKSKKLAVKYKEEIDILEKEIPYIDFWIKAFGDNGIRSFILGEIVPLLNARANYWLQFLIDNKVKITFNNQLEETIERNPSDSDPFVYNALSGGEHQVIDLGISQAFANITMLTSGSCPGFVILDEVGTNLDRPGIQGVFNMICELSRDRQVLIVTHDPELQDMLSVYDTITIVKENGISRLK